MGRTIYGAYKAPFTNAAFTQQRIDVYLSTA